MSFESYLKAFLLPLASIKYVSNNCSYSSYFVVKLFKFSLVNVFSLNKFITIK